jgi:transcriptional regulator with XRE-family HTH domain
MDTKNDNQVELARRSGVSQTHIGNILNHRAGPGPEIVSKLAAAYGRKDYELYIDGLHEEILGSTGNLSRLVSAYVSDTQTRKLLDAALELVPRKDRS